VDSDEMLTALRTTAYLPTTDPVFTDARLRVEITDAQHSIVERAVVNSGGDFWLKREKITTTAGKQRYRVPHRAVAGVIKAVRLGTGLTTDPPAPRHRFFGDTVEFDVAPSAGQVLTFDYYIRPSRMVAPQTAGAITAIDVATGTVTINVVPNRLLGAGAPDPIGGLDIIAMDIVRPNGWHEVVVASRIGIVVGLDVQLANTSRASEALTAGPADLSDVEVGDFVRAADESEWPCLPDDFHRMLANLSAANVLLAKKNYDGAGAIMQSAQPVMERLQDLLTPRNKTRPPVVKPTYGFLRRGGRRSFNGDMSR
jgi:hypothetical protein